MGRTVESVEVPTGFFADVYGRKKALVVASFWWLTAVTIYAFADSFVDFLIWEIFFAVAMSFTSGTASAFVYDSLQMLWREKEYKKLWWNALFYGTIAHGVANVIGWFIAEVDLRLTLYVSIPFFLVAVRLHGRCTSQIDKRLSSRNDTCVSCGVLWSVSFSSKESCAGYSSTHESYLRSIIRLCGSINHISNSQVSVSHISVSYLLVSKLSRRSRRNMHMLSRDGSDKSIRWLCWLCSSQWATCSCIILSSCSVFRFVSSSNLFVDLVRRSSLTISTNSQPQTFVRPYSHSSDL